MVQTNISIIVAIADNLAIGRNNQLLWHISEDLKRFKEITNGHSVIMGLKTFHSLPKLLPNRRNIVIDFEDITIEGAEVVHSIEEAVEIVKDEKEAFIIGGGQIYRQFLPLANKLYLTFVHTTVEDADTFFPEINFNEWRETLREEHPANEKCPYSYSFVNYERNE